VVRLPVHRAGTHLAAVCHQVARSIIIIAWIAQTFLQLVLLPIIIVGQNIQAKAADKRAEDTYKDAEAVLKEASMIQDHLARQDELISKIIEQLQPLVPKTP
jgi:hypothetical protein